MDTPPRAVCRNFRQKRMYFAGPGLDPAQYHEDSLAHCWCLHTQQAHGPDDRRVDVSDCQPSRRCFEPY